MRTIILLSALLFCTGCAASGAVTLPVCDGLSRRPANPHGSVLAPSGSASAPSAGADPVDAPAGGCA